MTANQGKKKDMKGVERVIEKEAQFVLRHDSCHDDDASNSEEKFRRETFPLVTSASLSKIYSLLLLTKFQSLYSPF